MKRKQAFSYVTTLGIAGLSALPCKTSAQEQYYPIKGEPMVKNYMHVVITHPPEHLKIHPFYKKYVDAAGIPITSSEKVSNDALLIARDIVNYMLAKRADIRTKMIEDGARLSIMAYSEMQTDLPEYSDWKKPAKDDSRLTPSERENYNKPGGITSMSDKEYWNKRARGMGGLETSCAEENLLGFPGTKYFGENILVHEWSHNILEALKKIDPPLVKSLEAAYEAARATGKYKDQYAINTLHEYWAEGTQWWFWSNYEFFDGETRVQSPDDLRAYDPALYTLLAKVYLGHNIPSDIYYGKNLRND